MVVVTTVTSYEQKSPSRIGDDLQAVFGHHCMACLGLAARRP